MSPLKIFYTKSLTFGTFFIVLHIISWAPKIMGLPQGAPETVCDTMLPFHGGGIAPSSTLSPFRIEPSSAVIGQGQTLRVDIAGLTAGLNFGGFMIQARNRNPPHQIIGQFEPINDGRAKLMNCENSVNNSATHTGTTPKREVVLEWLSPVDFLGDVVFNATVAQTYSEFWVGIESNPVQVVKRELAPSPGTTTTRDYGTTSAPFVPTYQPPTSAPIPPDPFYNGCGVQKTCFGMPNGCLSKRDCQSVTAVLVRGDVYEFELKSGRGQNAAYVAVGLSEDTKMGDDLVAECIPENGRVALYSSYTSASPYGVSRSGVPQNTARLIESSVIDGVIYCKFERYPVTVVRNHKFDLVKNKYHLLLASGSSVKENGAGFHDLGRLPAGKSINLAIVQDLEGSKFLLVKLHGAFMIAAWIGTTSLGIIFARYFKQTWVGSQMCGKDQWFVWHRCFMVTTWSLTVAAVVLIFVELGAWSSEQNPHAILGIITAAICFIQPLGALFRPSPTSRNRPYFNWLHWLGGNVAHILAIVTIFFSVKLTKAELPEWMDWILVAFVVFHVIVHLIFSIAGCVSDDQQTKRANTFQMDSMHHHHHGMRNGMSTERKLDAPYSGFRKGLLAVYTVVLILFVIALILLVVLSPIEQTFKSVQDKLSD